MISNGGDPVIAFGVCWSTDSIPTIAADTTIEGSGVGSFTSTAVYLVPNTTYFIRAYATNSVGTGYGQIESFTTLELETGTVTDYDGNIYQTVKIGDQWWMAENLKVTHYRNGDPIPNINDDATWANLTTGAYCSYNNDSANAETYGFLYNWFAEDDSRGLAPEGWHVPSDTEWKQLEMYLGMSPAEADATGWRGTNEGGKLKETDTVHWCFPNAGATNESGFTALPGGSRNHEGSFSDMCGNGIFWSSTEFDGNYAWCRYLMLSDSQVLRVYDWVEFGNSVRCIKDTDVNIIETSPLTNELNVNPDANILVRFSEDVDSASLNNSTIIVEGNLKGLYDGNISYYAPTYTLTYNPDDEFEPGELITVTLTTGIQTQLGATLESPYSFAFTVETNNGAGYLVPDTNYAVGSQPRAVAAGDFNNDGMIDLATANYDASSISVLMNSGTGKFEPQASYAVTGGPCSICASDLNRDGYLDLAVGNYWGPLSVIVMLNNGDGSFTSDSAYGDQYAPVGITCADFNGDGLADIATADSGDASVSVLLNVGNGVLSPAGTYSTYSYGMSIVASDLDNDNDIDLAAASFDSLFIFLNQGDGNFSPGLSYEAGLSATGIESADLDSDGYMDLMSTDLYRDTIRTYENAGDGTFPSHIPYMTGGYPCSVKSADFNGDGAIDVISTDSSGTVSLFLNNGDGSLSPRQEFNLYTVGPLMSAVADYDSDGDMDIATIVHSSDNILILFNQEEDVDIDIVPIDTADVYFIQAADLDRDNYMDIVYSSSLDTGLFVSYGDPIDTLLDPIKYLDIDSAAIAIGYIDRDTLLDIAAVDPDNIYILLNQGNRLFSTNIISLVKSQYFGDRQEVPSISLGHFNDDADLDFVVAPGVLYYGDGFGDVEFSQPLSYYSESVNVTDFDKDGWDDLLITGDDSVKILLNNTMGGFSQSGSAYLGDVALEYPPANAITDFNHDRIPDFALVQPLADPSENSQIVIGLGTGSGGFDDTAFTIPGKAYDLVTTDVNRDKEMDFVVSNGTYQRLEIYLGHGTGEFDAPGYVPLDAGDDLTFALSILDLNRDGNPDYISGGPGGDNLLAGIDQHEPTTESLDEMVVTGYNGITLEVINPDGFVISRNFQTVAGADYWVHDVDSDQVNDEESYDYNLQYGDYTIIIEPGTSGQMGCFDAGVRINGSVKAIIFDEYNVFGVEKWDEWNRTDSVVFHFAIEPQSSISPYNGQSVGDPTPTFNWGGLMEKDFPIDSFYFQISNYHDFRDTIEDSMGLLEALYTVKEELDTGKVYYWRFQPFQAGFGLDFSYAYAVYISSCICGDANSDTMINVSDAVYIINCIFLGGECPPLCSGDVNCDGSVNISDAVWIINYVFIGGNAPCDTDGDGIPDC